MVWNQQDDQLIAYSLGNFVSGQRPRYRDGGAMLWIDLQKIKNDSISTTSIKNAEYELEWVKKSNDKFVMMPFRYFEGDTLFVKEKTIRDAFALFAKDSRDLFNKHNVNIMEKSYPVKDTLVFSIRLESAPDLDSIALEDPVLKFYGIQKMDQDQNQRIWLAGTFYEYDIAQQALIEILSKTPFRTARIIRRVDIEKVNSTSIVGSKN